MKLKKNKLYGLVIALLVVIVGIYFVKVTIIGHVADINHIELELAEVNENQVDFQAYSTWSGNALKGYEYTYENAVLNISIIEVDIKNYLYQSGGTRGVIKEDFIDLVEIYIVDEDESENVWHK